MDTLKHMAWNAFFAKVRLSHVCTFLLYVLLLRLYVLAPRCSVRWIDNEVSHGRDIIEKILITLQKLIDAGHSSPYELVSFAGMLIDRVWSTRNDAMREG